MPNEFIIKNGFRSQGNSEITGSISVLGAISTLFSNNDGYFQVGNNNGGFVVENYNRTDVTLKANAKMTSRGTGITFRTTAGEPINNVPLAVIGTGATSGTTAFLVQNSNASSSLAVLDNGNVGIGTALPTNALSIGGNGTINFVSSGNISIPSSFGFVLSAGNVQISHNNSGLTLQNSFWFGGGANVYDNVGASQTNTAPSTNGSAVFQISSTRYGFLPPRMTLAQRVAISTPASGLIVYETGSATTEGIWVNETTGWQQLLTNTGSQNISGSLTVVGSSNLGGATFSNGGATFFNNVNLGALNEGSGNSWVNLNTTRVHLGQNGSTGGLNVTAATQFVGVGKMATAQLDILGNTLLTGSLSITSSAGTGSALYAYKSGSTVLDIQGSQGQLFSVVDALSGSLMSVNDVSGLPILEVFSDDRVVMGTYGAPALIVTGSNTVISGSLRGRVASLSIASNTASIDLSSNNFFTITLANGANTHINPTNIQPGQTVNVRVTQGSAGTGTVSFPSFVDQVSGSLYTGSAVANAVDIMTLISFDSSSLYLSAIRNLV